MNAEGGLGTHRRWFLLIWAHPSSTGLSLVPTRMFKTGYLPKKLSKHGKRQTTGYRMIFIEDLNQRKCQVTIWNIFAHNFAQPAGN